MDLKPTRKRGLKSVLTSLKGQLSPNVATFAAAVCTFCSMKKSHFRQCFLPESFLALNLTISSPILRRRRPRARSKTRAGAGPPARTRPQARARSRDELPSREESLCSQVGAAERTRQATMEVIETFSFPRSSYLYFLPWSQ